MHKIFDALDESQKKAVFHSHGPALVVAGPGSGKTTVILARVWYLIRQCHVPPEHILVLTFTKAAARSLQNRLFSFTGNVYVPVSFGTFHSFIFQILRQYGSYKDSSIITTKEKQALLAELGFCDRNLHKDILRAISYSLNNPDADIRHVLPAGISRECFEKLFDEYLQILKRDRLLDFDQMAELILELFRQSEWVLKLLREQYPYILVDEFQDTNPYQYEMLKQLSGETKELFVVGDDDQAIYSFRGSFPGIMRQFEKDYECCCSYYLSTNYRSMKQIVKDAGRLIADNKDRLSKQIVPFTEKMGAVRYLAFRDGKEEYTCVVSHLKEYAMNYPLSDLAIIARTNKQLEQCIPFLQRENIPFVIAEKSQTYKAGVTSDIYSLIAYILGDKGKIRLWRKIMKADACGPEFWENKQPVLFMQYLIHQTAYMDFIREREDFERQNQLLQEVKKESKKYKTLAAFSEYLKRQSMIQKQEVGVWLLTMHGAKGLEFSYVALIDVNEGIIPGKGSLSGPQLEEERRMLYVGMTRAKKILDVCYLKGTKEHPRFVSRFLNPLLSIAGDH